MFLWIHSGKEGGQWALKLYMNHLIDVSLHEGPGMLQVATFLCPSFASMIHDSNSDSIETVSALVSSLVLYTCCF